MTREGFNALVKYLADAWPTARVETWDASRLTTWEAELAPYLDDEVRKALRLWVGAGPRAFPPALNELVHAAHGVSDARRYRERAAREQAARAEESAAAMRRLDEWLAKHRGDA